jgi:hypothetical protein
MSGLSGIRRTVPPPPGAQDQARIDRLIAELKKRGVASDHCQRCGTSDWEVDFFQIPVAYEGVVSPVAGGIKGYVPVACFGCKNCGYLMYHNLLVLDQPK